MYSLFGKLDNKEDMIFKTIIFFLALWSLKQQLDNDFSENGLIVQSISFRNRLINRVKRLLVINCYCVTSHRLRTAVFMAIIFCQEKIEMDPR
jgi:hypothetical protein